MDPRDSPTPSSVISPATLSPTDSLPSLSSLPSLTFSSSSSSSAGQHKPTKLQIPEHTVEPRCRMKGEVVEYRSRNALARKISQLEEAGFQPVWSRENGYPGTIPEDIAEYIDINSQGKCRRSLSGKQKVSFELIWLQNMTNLLALSAASSGLPDSMSLSKRLTNLHSFSKMRFDQSQPTSVVQGGSWSISTKRAKFHSRCTIAIFGDPARPQW